ncbi:hypothetical protein EJB05_18413, partial [Eragrostis curvula]
MQQEQDVLCRDSVDHLGVDRVGKSQYLDLVMPFPTMDGAAMSVSWRCAPAQWGSAQRSTMKLLDKYFAKISPVIRDFFTPLCGYFPRLFPPCGYYHNLFPSCG